jgi:putative peptidoglycan lipid II flippase
MNSSEEAARYPGQPGLSTDGVAGVARSAGVVGGATLASRVLGLARDVVLANLFRAGATDAFFVAFMIPNLFRRLVAEGSLTVSFVPVFTDWLRRSREAAREFFGATWTLGLLAGLVLVAAGILFADPLVRVFAPGFGLDPEKHALCVRLLRLCFPYIGLLMLVALAMGALNALGHFLTPALAPVLLNLCLIGGAVIGHLWLDVPILALGGAVILAGVAQVALQMPPLRRRGMLPRLRFAPGHPALRRLGRLMAPAVLGASVYQLNVIVSRILASFLGDGAVSYLYYADRLLEFPLGVFVVALGTASLPAFSRLAKAGEREPLRDAFTGTLLLALGLALPSTAGLILLREPLFAVLFGWNPAVFGAGAVEGCARALLFYALGLVPISVARLWVGLCVAHENTATPARGAVVALVVNLLAALVLIGPLPAEGLPAPLRDLQHRLVLADLGYAGLALAASVASLANALYLWSAARSRYGALLAPDVAGRAARLLAATAVLCGVVTGGQTLVPVPQGASPLGFGLLGMHVALGALAYGATLRALRSPDLESLLALGRRRESA